MLVSFLPLLLGAYLGVLGAGGRACWRRGQGTYTGRPRVILSLPPGAPRLYRTSQSRLIHHGTCCAPPVVRRLLSLGYLEWTDVEKVRVSRIDFAAENSYASKCAGRESLDCESPPHHTANKFVKKKKMVVDGCSRSSSVWFPSLSLLLHVAIWILENHRHF